METTKGQEKPGNSGELRGTRSSVLIPYTYSVYWRAALVCFALAGLTGSLYRFGLVLGLPWKLELTNVRHAHSHLMYFSWVTPALMALMAARLPDLLPAGWAVPARRFRWPIIGALAMGLAAYPFFLLFGYQAVAIGSAQLPLAAIIGSLNTFAWYGFVWAYCKTTRKAPRVLPLRLWDGAVVMLVLSSLGGWGVVIVTRLGIESLFATQAFTHLFLDLFADGWFVLGVLGLAYVSRPELGQFAAAKYADIFLIIGLPLSFLLTVPVALVPPMVRAIAGLSGLLVGIGLALNTWLLWPRRNREQPRRWSMWSLPLVFLALRTLAEIGIALPVAAQWAERMSLRLSYLHWLLLGFVTLGLVAAANELPAFLRFKNWRAFSFGVVLIILSLVPLTRLWPASLSGIWVIWFAAAMTLVPVVVVLGELMGTRKNS